MIDYSSTLKALNEVKTSFTYPIFVPSLDRDVRFMQMTTAHQKNFVKISMLSQAAQSISFTAATRSLILETCAESIDVDNLTVLDRIIICLMIRIMSVGNTMEVSIDTNEDNENSENRDKNKPESFSINIDLGMLYKKAISEYTKIDTSKQTIAVDGYPISVQISIPTIKEEAKILPMLENINKVNGNDSDNEKYAKVFSDTFYVELIKYIRTVSIKNTTTQEETVIDFSELTPKQMLDVALNIPASVTSAIILRVNQLISSINGLTMFNVKHNGREYSYNVEVLDSNFFIAL